MLYPSELRARKEAEKNLPESVLILPRRIQAAKVKEVADAHHWKNTRVMLGVLKSQNRVSERPLLAATSA